MIVASVATAAVEEIPNFDKTTPISFPIAFGIRRGMKSAGLVPKNPNPKTHPKTYPKTQEQKPIKNPT